ncbi:MAG: alpha/beta fold hydrolase, partial [Alphaproteobacteria bacterium]
MFTASDSTRTGPRPLGLYFALLQHGQGVGQWLNALPPQQMTMLAPWQEALKNLQATPADTAQFLQGVAAYHAHPYHRPRAEEDYTLVKNWGRVRLLHAGGPSGKGGQPVLLVPSVINTSAIFDLTPECSLVQFLVKQGYAVYVLDWGIPTVNEASHTVESLIVQCLLPALAEMPAPPILLGYCMGGLLALAAAQLAPTQVKGLVLAATPWDFAATPTHTALKNNVMPLEMMLANAPLIPPDMVQAPFVLQEPWGAIRRMQAFATEQDPKILNRLAALEDWLADGVPLEPAIAKTLLLDWHRDNQTQLGAWQVAGQHIALKNIQTPTLVVVA